MRGSRALKEPIDSGFLYKHMMEEQKKYINIWPYLPRPLSLDGFVISNHKELRISYFGIIYNTSHILFCKKVLKFL